MKAINEIRSALTKHEEKLRQEYGVEELGIFGSYARGEQKKKAISTYWLSSKCLSVF